MTLTWHYCSANISQYIPVFSSDASLVVHGILAGLPKLGSCVTLGWISSTAQSQISEMDPFNMFERLMDFWRPLTQKSTWILNAFQSNATWNGTSVELVDKKVIDVYTCYRQCFIFCFSVNKEVAAHLVSTK